MIPLKDDNPRNTFPLATVVIIAINIVVFFFEVQAGYSPIIERYGAVPQQLLRGRFLETILTSMFLHGGFMHLGGNMLYLWIFGDNIEHYLGSGRFVMFYLACGLLALAAHVAIGGSSEIPLVGASGAISGVLGAYMVKYPRAKVLVLIPIIWFLTIRAVPAIFVLGFWFVMQLFSGIGTIGAEGGGVAFWAHIGGFVAGAGLIFLFPARRRHRIADW